MEESDLSKVEMLLELDLSRLWVPKNEARASCKE